MYEFVRSFIHSGYFYSASSSLSQRCSRHSTDTVSEFHAETHRQLLVKNLPKGSYVAARAGIKPTTLWLTAIDSINEPPRPTMLCTHTITITPMTHHRTLCCTLIW